MTKNAALPLSLLAALALGCAPGSNNGDAGSDGDGGEVHDHDAGPADDDAGPVDQDAGPDAPPASYSFQSRFGDESSVSYGGQVQRQLHLAELKNFIGGLTDVSYAGGSAEDVVTDLSFFFDYSNAGGSGDDSISIGLDDGAEWLQATFGDVGSPASVKEKMPDQDIGWTEGVVGYGDGTLLPTAVVEAWFDELADLLIARANGTIPTDPDGADIAKPYVTADGRDLSQLVQKYLGGAVAFSQGSSDYLADGPAGKGLSSDNVAQVEGKPYTQLEHHWDEGFGYFGASRDYGDYTDDEIAGAGGRDDYKNGFHDSDGDGFIDARSEYIFGHAQNAGKRDRGSADSAATDFSGDAFSAFIAGRHLITSSGGALSDGQMAELKGHRDRAVSAWEKAIAASAVHYINDVLGDMSKFGVACDGINEDTCYKFLDHAKHWSELKGFALALQFNVRSPLSDSDLAELHSLLGDAPVLPTAASEDITAYKQALRDARAILGDTYGFAAANLGDDDGNNGW